jgi:acyl-coenzyme A thioesterase PaaI-like protein
MRNDAAIPAISLKPKTKQCYVCGPENLSGLQVPFYRDGETGSTAVYQARAGHGDWPGLLHGGVTVALMDEALGYALYFQGLRGVTARIEARFRAPISIGMNVVIRAWTIDRKRRVVTARAEVSEDCGPAATSRSRCHYVLARQRAGRRMSGQLYDLSFDNVGAPVGFDQSSAASHTGAKISRLAAVAPTTAFQGIERSKVTSCPPWKTARANR